MSAALDYLLPLIARWRETAARLERRAGHYDGFPDVAQRLRECAETKRWCADELERVVKLEGNER